MSARKLLEKFGEGPYNQGVRLGMDPKIKDITVEKMRSVAKSGVRIPAWVGKKGKSTRKAQYKRLPKKSVSEFMKGFIFGRK